MQFPIGLGRRWNRHRDRGADSEPTLDFERSVMKLNDVLDDSQTEPGSAHFA